MQSADDAKNQGNEEHLVQIFMLAVARLMITVLANDPLFLHPTLATYLRRTGVQK